MVFDFDGKRYKEASKHQKEWGNKIIQEMNIKEDSFILDLGCGDGVLTQILSSKVPKGKVMGIDASKGMIDTAIEIREENLEFRNKVVEKMLERTKQEDGTYFETFRRINIIAEKV